MSRLAEFRKLEQRLADQLAELETLKNDTSFKKEIEFEAKLRGLLNEYGFSLREIIGIFDLQATNGRKAPPIAEKKTRKARELKCYKNPLTEEVVQTRGGNHKVLKDWRAQFGTEVESWLVR